MMPCGKHSTVLWLWQDVFLEYSYAFSLSLPFSHAIYIENKKTIYQKKWIENILIPQKLP